MSGEDMDNSNKQNTKQHQYKEQCNQESSGLSSGKKLIEDRLRKLDELRGEGINPYPYRFDSNSNSEKIKCEFVHLSPEEHSGEIVKIAGRIVLFRRMGKVAFLTIYDGEGKIQLYLRADDIGPKYELLKKFDIGDFIGVEGEIFRTKMGEISIYVKNFEMLSKTMRPLPDKFHGVQDLELKYRKRYLDLIMNNSSRKSFIKGC
jgi:lysyl-tRNA synthetase class 2